MSRSSSTITTHTPRHATSNVLTGVKVQHVSTRGVLYSKTRASKRASYTAAFKLKVIETAEKCGNRAAGREYSVNERLVSDWRKKAELESLPRGKRSLIALGKYTNAQLVGSN